MVIYFSISCNFGQVGYSEQKPEIKLVHNKDIIKDTIQDTSFQSKIFDNTKGGKLNYRFFEIADTTEGKKYPLIIFLHGAGERGTDNEKQLTHGAKKFAEKQNLEKFPCFVIAPQCEEQYRWVEVDWTLPAHKMPEKISVPLGLTVELIEEIIKKYAIDTNRIYVTGLSMGGYGTWDLISRFPNKFAAAVPICGGADENIACNIKDVPIWCFHGAKDKLVLVSRSRNMINALKKCSGTPKYTEYPTLGHFSWGQAYNEKELIPWMFSQKKN